MGTIIKRLSYYSERDGYKIFSHTQEINFDEEKLNSGFYQAIDAIENAIIPENILLDNEILVLGADGKTFEVRQDWSEIIFYHKDNKSEKRYNFLESPDFVNYTNIPPIPNEQFQIFDIIENEWIVDIQSKLNYLKEQKLNEIKSKEYEKLEDGFLYTLNGTQYRLDSNQKAQIFISGLLTALNSGIISGLDGYTVEDIQGNNIEINLTGYQIIEVAGAILNQVKTIHSWKRTKEDELKLISSITELELFEVV